MFCIIYIYKVVTDKIDFVRGLSLIKFIPLLPVLLTFLPEEKLFVQRDPHLTAVHVSMCPRASLGGLSLVEALWKF